MNPQPASAAANRGGGAGGRGRGAAAAPASPAEPLQGCTASPAAIAVSKQLAMTYLNAANGAARAQTLADDYVDHSPRKVDPPASPARTRDHILAECDYVSVVWKQVLPDPDNASRTWEAFTFDAFRIKDGKIAEHWDGDRK
jgi:hypothetical protein